MTEILDPSETGFLARELEHDGEPWLYVVHRPPGFSERERWPCILFLHGMGECGDDGMQHVTVGLPPYLHKRPDRWPFVAVLPQKKHKAHEWIEHEDVLLEMVDRAVAQDRADEQHLHLTGLSQGGHGALALGARHPRRWRTVSAACPYVSAPEGGWEAPADEHRWDAQVVAAAAAEFAAGLADTPVRLFHGDADPAVPVAQSLAAHEALRSRNPDAHLTLYPGVGHACWDAMYAIEDLGRWMLTSGRTGA